MASPNELVDPVEGAMASPISTSQTATSSPAGNVVYLREGGNRVELGVTVLASSDEEWLKINEDVTQEVQQHIRKHFPGLEIPTLDSTRPPPIISAPKVVKTKWHALKAVSPPRGTTMETDGPRRSRSRSRSRKSTPPASTSTEVTQGARPKVPSSSSSSSVTTRPTYEDSTSFWVQSRDFGETDNSIMSQLPAICSLFGTTMTDWRRELKAHCTEAQANQIMVCVATVKIFRRADDTICPRTRTGRSLSELPIDQCTPSQYSLLMREWHNLGGLCPMPGCTRTGKLYTCDPLVTATGKLERRNDVYTSGRDFWAHFRSEHAPLARVACPHSSCTRKYGSHQSLRSHYHNSHLAAIPKEESLRWALNQIHNWGLGEIDPGIDLADLINPNLRQNLLPVQIISETDAEYWHTRQATHTPVDGNPGRVVQAEAVFRHYAGLDLCIVNWGWPEKAPTPDMWELERVEAIRKCRSTTKLSTVITDQARRNIESGWVPGYASNTAWPQYHIDRCPGTIPLATWVPGQYAALHDASVYHPGPPRWIPPIIFTAPVQYKMYVETGKPPVRTPELIRIDGFIPQPTSDASVHIGPIPDHNQNFKVTRLSNPASHSDLPTDPSQPWTLTHGDLWERLTDFTKLPTPVGGDTLPRGLSALKAEVTKRCQRYKTAAKQLRQTPQDKLVWQCCKELFEKMQYSQQMLQYREYSLSQQHAEHLGKASVTSPSETREAASSAAGSSVIRRVVKFPSTVSSVSATPTTAVSRTSAAQTRTDQPKTVRFLDQSMEQPSTGGLPQDGLLGACPLSYTEDAQPPMEELLPQPVNLGNHYLELLYRGEAGYRVDQPSSSPVSFREPALDVLAALESGLRSLSPTAQLPPTPLLSAEDPSAQARFLTALCSEGVSTFHSLWAIAVRAILSHEQGSLDPSWERIGLHQPICLSSLPGLGRLEGLPDFYLCGEPYINQYRSLEALASDTPAREAVETLERAVSSKEYRIGELQTQLRNAQSDLHSAQVLAHDRAVELESQRETHELLSCQYKGKVVKLKQQEHDNNQQLALIEQLRRENAILKQQKAETSTYWPFKAPSAQGASARPIPSHTATKRMSPTEEINPSGDSKRVRGIGAALTKAPPLDVVRPKPTSVQTFMGLSPFAGRGGLPSLRKPPGLSLPTSTLGLQPPSGVGRGGPIIGQLPDSPSRSPSVQANFDMVEMEFPERK